MKLSEMNQIMAALITPFDQQGRVNLKALREIIRYEMAMGIRCYYVCGTTGEGLSMSADERKSVVETTCDELSGKGASTGSGQGGVIVNVSHMEFVVAIDLARHAKQAGADAVSTLPPLFYPVTSKEIEQYYRALLDAVELPLTLYNIPMLSKLALDEPMVTRLAEHPCFGGIKHSSEDTFLLNRFKQIAGGRLMVWSGRDAYYLGALAMGADGAIGNSFNLMGDLFVKMTSLYRANQTEQALALQQKANEVHRRLQVYGATPSVKRCLQMQGIDAGHCRLPYQPLPAEADKLLREAVAILQSIRTDLGEPRLRTA
jgi:N-acetylneuraminate lyase